MRWTRNKGIMNGISAAVHFASGNDTRAVEEVVPTHSLRGQGVIYAERVLAGVIVR